MFLHSDKGLKHIHQHLKKEWRILWLLILIFKYHNDSFHFLCKTEKKIQKSFTNFTIFSWIPWNAITWIRIYSVSTCSSILTRVWRTFVNIYKKEWKILRIIILIFNNFYNLFSIFSPQKSKLKNHLPISQLLPE